MISAAPVMMRAVEPTPKVTASVVSPRLVVALADPAEQEHLVVHREAEQHREEEERHPGLDRVRLLEAEQIGADALLEDEHEQAVGGADREQVERDRRRRRRRPSGRRPSAGRSVRSEHEGDHERRRVDHGVEVVDVLRARAADEHLGVGARERLRDDLVAELADRVDRLRSPTGRLRPAPTSTATSPSAERSSSPSPKRGSAARRARELGERRSTRPRRDAFETTISAGSVVVPREVALERDEALLRDEAVGQRARRRSCRCSCRTTGQREREQQRRPTSARLSPGRRRTRRTIAPQNRPSGFDGLERARARRTGCAAR